MALPRTLVVGFDGGTWDLLDPLLSAGWLPNLRRFLAGALRAGLRSVDPPVTIPAWYSAMTGLSPGQMDIWGFAKPTHTPGELQLVRTYRPHEAIWDILGRRGWRIGVVNFPAVPAPPVHGYFVSGMVGGTPEEMVYPSALRSELGSPGNPWHHDLFRTKGDGLRASLTEAMESMDQKARFVEARESSDPSDLLFVLFSETDRIQHNFLHSLRHPAPEDLRDVRAFWGTLDDAFGRVLAAFHGEGSSPGYTWLLSDHGFGPAEGYVFTNRYLIREGYLVKGASAPFRWRPFVSDVAARVDALIPLAPFVRPKRAGASRPLPGGSLQDGDGTDQTFSWYSRFVDWSRTRAVSFPVPEAIYANHYRGEMTPESLRSLRKDLARSFARFPGGAIEAVDPSRLYGVDLGPMSPLLLLSSHGGAWEVRGDMNHLFPRLPRRPSYFEREGTHRPVGIFAVAGPGIPPGTRSEPFPLLGVFPLILSALGVRPPGAGGAPVPGDWAKLFPVQPSGRGESPGGM